MCQETDYASMSLTGTHFEYVHHELGMWHSNYYQGRGTVLDIGAGCGETAKFFLSHGADRVIAFEMDSSAIRHFQKNFPEAYIVPESARIVLIPSHVDHVKVDIEGAEKGMIVETHFPPRWRLLGKDHTTRLWRLDRSTSLHERRIGLAHWVRVHLLK